MNGPTQGLTDRFYDLNALMIDQEKLTKRYYTIGEVADMIGESTSLLRYWESVFPKLNPRKDKGGIRRYTTEDIMLIDDIHHLVKHKGYTLDGAKEGLVRRKNLKIIRKKLQDIREGLTELRQQLMSEGDGSAA